MITLQSIEIEGFGSVITPIKYKINNPGLNKIEGLNGSGKTTITNALAWVGWGQLVKPKKSSIIPWPHIIDENYHGTRVLLKFHDEKDKYQIIRCNEYKGKLFGKAGGNRLIVLKNGKELEGDGLRNKADYQKWIINKIGYSFDLFKSTVLFTQELDNLMKEDGPSRKKIFDEAFETMFVNKAKERVEDRLEKSDKDYEWISHEITLKKEIINGMKKEIRVIRESLANFEESKRNRINKLQEEIKAYKIEIGKIENDLQKALKIESKIKKFNKKYKEQIGNLDNEDFKLEMQINGKEELIEMIDIKIKTLKESFSKPKKVCGECGKPIDANKIIDYKKGIKKEISNQKTQKENLSKKIEELKEERRKIKNTLKGADKVKKAIEKYESQLKEGSDIIKEKLRNIKNSIDKLEQYIQSINDEKPLSTKLPQIYKHLSTCKKDLRNKIEERKSIYKEMKIDKWLIKDPLSNSGLKSFIFDTMLAKVNNYLKQYKDIIGFGVKVFIDMSSANKDIRILIERNGDEVPYEDLSKGQKQLVHVVLAFSLSDTVQSIKPINAIFLDELFESLAADNIEKVGKIIEAKSKNRSIHLITHQSSFSPLNCNTVYVELNTKGQTHLF